MNAWFYDVEAKRKKGNQILFTRDSACLQELRRLICEQTHLTLVLWAFDCMRGTVSELMERYPAETDIQAAYDRSLAWAHGEMKMPPARTAIIRCHGVAKRIEDRADQALCHAIGQGCGTVHVETHAFGLAMYELTAIVLQCGGEFYQNKVCQKIDDYMERLKWWQEAGSISAAKEPWADFLIRPGQINKEQLLFNKQQFAIEGPKNLSRTSGAQDSSLPSE